MFALFVSVTDESSLGWDSVVDVRVLKWLINGTKKKTIPDHLKWSSALIRLIADKHASSHTHDNRSPNGCERNNAATRELDDFKVMTKPMIITQLGMGPTFHERDFSATDASKLSANDINLPLTHNVSRSSSLNLASKRRSRPTSRNYRNVNWLHYWSLLMCLTECSAFTWPRALTELNV